MAQDYVYVGANYGRGSELKVRSVVTQRGTVDVYRTGNRPDFIYEARLNGVSVATGLKTSAEAVEAAQK